MASYDFGELLAGLLRQSELREAGLHHALEEPSNGRMKLYRGAAIGQRELARGSPANNPWRAEPSRRRPIWPTRRPGKQQPGGETKRGGVVDTDTHAQLGQLFVCQVDMSLKAHRVADRLQAGMAGAG